MKLRLIFVVLAVAIGVLPAQGEDAGCEPAGGTYSRVSAPATHDILPGVLVNLRSDADGEQIQIAYVRPDTSAPVPVIVLASPYFRGGLADAETWQCNGRLVQNFVPQGYAVAFVPVRGTADTGGCMDLMGDLERADLDQAITWLGTRSWSNGSVGMLGVSYDGSTPWEVAGEGNPYLKTIVPVSGVNDLYHLMYRNGGNELRGPLVLNALYYQYGFVEYNPMRGRSESHTISGALCPESLKGLGMSGHSAATGERDPLGFWAERNSRPRVEQNWRGTIMHVQGLEDWNVDPGHQYPWITSLEEQGFTVKHVLGQWGHAWPDSPGFNVRGDWADVLLTWFDRWLKGDTSVDTGARAEIQDSSGQWRADHSWPPSDASTLELEATAAGLLSASGSDEESIALIRPQSERALPACVACLRFVGEPLTEHLRFAGRPSLDLTVIPSGPGGHIYATISTESGRRLGWGQIDLRFPEGAESAATVVPGQEITVSLSFQPLDAVVEPGERLMLRIGQGYYGDHLPSVPTFPIGLRLGKGATALSLGTFARDGSSFFTPPPLPGS